MQPGDRLRPWVPTLATYGVLVAGVLSIQASLHLDYLLAAQLILTAAVLDSLDGTLAINRDPAFVPTSGSISLLSGASRTGAFAKETE